MQLQVRVSDNVVKLTSHLHVPRPEPVRPSSTLGSQFYYSLMLLLDVVSGYVPFIWVSHDEREGEEVPMGPRIKGKGSFDELSK